jgi:hypothetical protein
MSGNRSFWTTFYLWIRSLHLYFGLFVSPLVLVFAISTIMLNHNWKPNPTVEKSVHPIKLVEGLVDYPQARQILDQLNITGEVNFVRGFRGAEIVRIPVVKPGARTVVNVNVKESTAEVERHHLGFLHSLLFLHIIPGPHKAESNWVFTKLWGAVSDTTVYLIIFLSISGIYMWAVLKGERKPGFIFLGLGCASFLAILAGLLGA